MSDQGDWYGRGFADGFQTAVGEVLATIEHARSLSRTEPRTLALMAIETDVRWIGTATTGERLMAHAKRVLAKEKTERLVPNFVPTVATKRKDGA